MRDILMLTTKISKTKVKKKKRMPEKSESMASSTVRRVGGRREGGGGRGVSTSSMGVEGRLWLLLCQDGSLSHTHKHTHIPGCASFPPR